MGKRLESLNRGQERSVRGKKSERSKKRKRRKKQTDTTEKIRNKEGRIENPEQNFLRV